jgi:hypothetical protein
MEPWCKRRGLADLREGGNMLETTGPAADGICKIERRFRSSCKCGFYFCNELT